MNACLAACLLLGLLQETPESLLRKLSEGSIEERDRAAEQLIEGGDSVRADLEKARATSDAALRARVERILKAIEIRNEMQSFRSAPTRVTLSGDLTLQEAASTWSRQSGRALTCESWPAGTFRIDVKEMPSWDALEAMCAASGRRTPEITREGVKLSGDRYVRKPHLEKDGVTIRLDAVERGREFDIVTRTGKKQLAICLALGWDRSISPVYEYWEVHSAVDDQGVDHKKAIDDFDRDSTAGVTMSAEDPAPRVSERYWLVTESPPGEKSRTIDLKGRLILWAKASPDRISFTTPRTDTEEDIEVPETVSVFDVSLRPTARVQLTLFNMGRNGALLRVEGVDRRMFRNCTYLTFLTDKNKQSYPGHVMDEPNAATVLNLGYFNFPESAVADRITLRIPRRVIQIEIPFEFKNIPVN